MFRVFLIIIIMLAGSIDGYAQTIAANISVVSVTINEDETASGTGLPIIFNLTNISSETAHVLKWGTPLENGFSNDMFEVWQGNTQISYTGMFIKRGKPKADDFVTLEPGETVSGNIDIADGYAVHEAGEYKIAFSSMITINVTDESAQNDSDVVNQDGIVHLHVESETITTSLYFDRPQLLTKSPPVFDSCTSSQRNILDNALTQAEILADNSLNALNTTPAQQRQKALRYTTWFGSYTSQRYNHVSSQFLQTHDVVANRQIEFNCFCDPQRLPSSASPEDIFAYVNSSDREPYEISLCGQFWAANMTGRDSKAGTIIHEISHFNTVAATRDIAVGSDPSLALAQNNPDLAIRNADSHEYFAENTPFLPMGSAPSSADDNITQLSLNQPVTDQIAESSWRYYKVTGASRVELSNMTKDFDLFVKAGGIPSGDDYDCKSVYFVGTDACDISSSDTVFVGVKSYSFTTLSTNGGGGTFTLLAEGISSSGLPPILFDPLPPLTTQLFTPKPGLWWSPQKQDGNGFDIHVNGDQLIVVWYTYDEAGNPVWYLGDGNYSNNQGSGTLFRSSISYALGSFIGTQEIREVGTLQVNLNDSTHGTITWSLNGQSGSQAIEYYSVSNQLPTVDHTGLWYDPDDPGYGITVHEQGSTIVTVVYYYSFLGAPLWALGDDSNNYRLSSYQGACPYCTPTQSTFNANIGEIAINFLSKKEGLFSSSFDPIGQFFNFSDVWFINNTRIVNLTP